MKRKLLLFILIYINFLTFLSAQNDNLFMNVHKKDNSVVQIRVDDIDSITFVEPDIAALYITTENYVTEITSKTEYVKANLKIDGKGFYMDYEGETSIRGRGNTTWGYSKKPYRLKLSSKSALLDMKPAKNFVLLAGYLDGTLMVDAIGYKIAELAGLPYANTARPVDVYLNNIYKGIYIMTEQIEMHESRVNLDKDNSIIWELDSYMDSPPYQFYSSPLNLPVMVKDMEPEDDENFEYWKNDLTEFLTEFNKSPIVNSNYRDYLDLESAVSYFITYNLTRNQELNHPKSTYMYKTKGGKYIMGPVWDFDWAFGYSGSGFIRFQKMTTSVFDWNEGDKPGRRFFKRFLEDPEFVELYKKRWEQFKSKGKFDELMDYISHYEDLISKSIDKNTAKWSQTRNYSSQINDLRNWLRGRSDYMDKECEAW